MWGHLRRIIFFQVRFPPAGLGQAQSSPALLSLFLPPFGITSRQNMQSLWLVAQQGADSKCPRQKLFHIPQQEGLQPSSKKMDLLLLLSSSQKRFVPRLQYSKVRSGFDFAVKSIASILIIKPLWSKGSVLSNLNENVAQSSLKLQIFLIILIKKSYI